MVTEGNREISFVIEKYLGVLSEAQNGWRKELNLVSWNGKKAKLDIREWSPDHTRMAKGITLRYEEARVLQRSLYRWLTGYGKPEPEKPREEVSPSAAAEEPLQPELSDEEFFSAVTDPETGEIFETGEAVDTEFTEEAPAEPAEMAEALDETASASAETSDF